MARHVIALGKIDYNRSGRRNCLATLEINWDGVRFSASANVWNPRQTDIYMGGQCLEEVCALFPNDTRAQAVLVLWRHWHLNDMRAGSPAQEAWLEANPIKPVYPQSYYELACEALAAAGLNPDPTYLHEGKPHAYAYGSAWLKREIPADVVAEIEAAMEF